MSTEPFFSYIEKNFGDPAELSEICRIYEDFICGKPLLLQLDKAIENMPYKLYGNFRFYTDPNCREFFGILNSAIPGGVDADAFRLAVFIALCDGAKKRICGMGISENIAESTVASVALGAKKHKRLGGTDGLCDYRWCIRYLCGAVLHIGSLDFEPAKNNDIRLPQKCPDGIKINIHIPENTDFSYEARKASYLEAYGIFSQKLQLPYVVFVCESWLLSLDHEALGQCNINSFRRDFNIYNYYYDAEKDFLWRIFGNADLSFPQNLPQSNRIMRLYRTKLIKGEKFCSGTGYFVIKDDVIL